MKKSVLMDVSLAFAGVVGLSGCVSDADASE